MLLSTLRARQADKLAAGQKGAQVYLRLARLREKRESASEWRRQRSTFSGNGMDSGPGRPAFLVQVFAGLADIPIVAGNRRFALDGQIGLCAPSPDREHSAMEADLTTADGMSGNAVDGMAQAIIEQTQSACAELQRVDELLGHAIGQLMAAFSSVSEQAQAHRAELTQAAAAAHGTPGAQRLRAAAERVASDVDGAVTALQFRDVVGQKLGHVRLELAALEQAMHRVREVAAQCAHAELAQRVGGVLQQLRQARAASPARQELMHAGEVELF